MLAKGDLKFRLKGKRLKGDFALIKMRERRPGSKGNEWLMIKKQDDKVVEGYDVGDIRRIRSHQSNYDEIAGDARSAEWKQPSGGHGKVKAAWLADAIARAEKKRKTKTAETPKSDREEKRKKRYTQSRLPARMAALEEDRPKARNQTPSENSASSGRVNLPGPIKRPCLRRSIPCWRSRSTMAFNSPDWLFEIKWDGYRAVAFIDDGKVRLVSRNQNELTGQYPELKDMPKFIKAKNAILDGEVVALDDEGKALVQPDAAANGISSGRQTPAAKARMCPSFTTRLICFTSMVSTGDSVPLEERKRKLASRS